MLTDLFWVEFSRCLKLIDNILLIISVTVAVLIAVLTGAGDRASKRSLIVRFTVSGQVPCSGA